MFRIITVVVFLNHATLFDRYIVYDADGSGILYVKTLLSGIYIMDVSQLKHL
jgi:hypothetical protein